MLLFKTRSQHTQILYISRLAIALDMCNTHEGLLDQALSNEDTDMFLPYGEDRPFQIAILRELLKLEPEIERTLKIYAYR